MTIGTVYLVGAGPGDPELLTLAGKRRLETAQCVLYDSLANPALLDLVPPDAERVHVGKRAGQQYLKQDQINRIILDKAKAHQRVVRLKGGDPFVFGRGGEEALFLHENGVPFEVIPGVTAAVAGAAYAGIPATHRGLATTIALATGTEDPTKPETQTDWGRLSASVGTLAVYMGVKQLQRIVGRLQRPPDTPAALVENATLPSQRTVVGTLGTIVDLARTENVKPPAVFFLGEVISLRERLNWFEKRPLFGKRILVTRPRERAGRFRAALADLGAHVIEMPTIRIESLEDFTELDKAIADLATYDWVVFTSPAGADRLFERAGATGRDARAFGDARVVAIGPGTAETLARRGIRPDFVPTRFTSDAVVKELGAREHLDGKRILLPRADIATDILPDGLAQLGARLTRVTAYRTVEEDDLDPELLDTLRNGRLDAATFTSASTVENFARKLQRASIELPPSVRMISIGPVTSARMRDLGFPVTTEADPHDLAGLTDAVLTQFNMKESGGADCDCRK